MPRTALLLAALATAAAARDATIGLCTREKDMAKALESIDREIQALTSAKSEKEKGKLGKALAKKYGKSERIECLIRYREPDLRHVFVPLLDHKHWPTRARALFGLKMLGDAAAVPEVTRALRDRDARVREAAANCLCRLATEVPAELRKAAETERDRFAKASMEAAITAIEAGARPWRDWQETLTGPEGAQRVEWVWALKGKNSFNVYDARTLDYPVTDGFDWPISWYEGSLFAPVPRNSFGAGGTHTGEDMAWFREGASMFAVANGIVRMIQGAGGDWGFLVAIEHRLPSGDYIMAVYGHAGWDILVTPGDVVRRGQRIATVGMSCSTENGGYGAHLHFGLSEGPFRRPAGVAKGSKVRLEIEGKAQEAPVLRLAYDPEKSDAYGFPGLGLVVRLPDGSERLLPTPSPDMGRQVGWMQGYVKDCVGWFDPRTFIEERLAQ